MLDVLVNESKSFPLMASGALCWQEAGFSTVELNASDKRSKRSLKEDMAEALGNQTLVDYMGN